MAGTTGTSIVAPTNGRTLFDVLKLVGPHLRGSRVRHANAAGTTTTLVDTLADEPYGYWVDGSILLLATSTVVAITAWDEIGKTWTFTPAQTGATASGNQYIAIPPIFPFFRIMAAVNDALADMGSVLQYTDTLVVDEDVEEYALDYTVSTTSYSIRGLVRVEEAQSSTAPYQWKKNLYWKEVNGHLVFETGHAPANDGYKLRLWYYAPHSVVDQVTDVISPEVNLERLKWATLASVYQMRYAKVGSDEPAIAELLNIAISNRTRMEQLYPIRRMAKDQKLAAW